jgi:two-component system chemotaxis response regulator CheB
VSKLRVLIVDDAVVIRRIVSDVLASDPDIEVAGTAANGKIALSKISQLNPDLVTLDVEMPEMDGLQTVRAIRKAHPKLPVIMFSTLTSRGASTTLDALSAGASDYVTKPANVGSVSVAIARIREELIPKIKALCGRFSSAVQSSSAGTSTAETSRRSTSAAVNAIPLREVPAGRANSSPVEIVVIGVSTGGPNALAEVIPAIPGNLPVPILIVQHMPPVFTKALADRLNQKSAITVKEAENNEEAKPGCVYIAPGDFHMTVERAFTRRVIRLNQSAPENSCRPAVDVLFRSAAVAGGIATLAVILTGMGQDGLRGSQMLVENGGRLIAQDEATSVVWGMPGFVARAGLAEKLFALDQIAGAIEQRVMERRRGVAA